MLASHTGSAHGQILGLGGPATYVFNQITGAIDESFDVCAAIGGYSEKVNFRIAAAIGAAEMTVLDDRHYRQAMPGLADERYIQFCDEVDIPFGCQTALMTGSESLVGLALLRNRRDGAVTPEQRAIFAGVAPHVRAAVVTQMSLRNEGHTLLAGGFDAVAAKALVCDGYGRIRAVTAGADELLSRGGRLALRDGLLESRIGIETRRIHAALAQALGSDAVASDDILLPAIAGMSEEIRLSVRPIPRMSWDFGHMPRAVITLHAREPVPAEALARIAARFGLTPSEAEVAAALASGMSRARIAQSRNVSVDTVKSQLKSVFSKMYINREAELVGMLRQMC